MEVSVRVIFKVEVFLKVTVNLNLPTLVEYWVFPFVFRMKNKTMFTSENFYWCFTGGFTVYLLSCLYHTIRWTLQKDSFTPNLPLPLRREKEGSHVQKKSEGDWPSGSRTETEHRRTALRGPIHPSKDKIQISSWPSRSKTNINPTLIPILKSQTVSHVLEKVRSRVGTVWMSDLYLPSQSGVVIGGRWYNS